MAESNREDEERKRAITIWEVLVKMTKKLEVNGGKVIKTYVELGPDHHTDWSFQDDWALLLVSAGLKGPFRLYFLKEEECNPVYIELPAILRTKKAFYNIINKVVNGNKTSDEVFYKETEKIKRGENKIKLRR